MLWGISWINLQVILADAMVVDTTKHTDGDNTDDNTPVKEVIHRKLSSKEDIKNYIKGII